MVTLFVRNKFKHARSGNLSKIAENFNQRLGPIYARSTSNFFDQYSLTAVVARCQAQQLGEGGRFGCDGEHDLANVVRSAKSEQ